MSIHGFRDLSVAAETESTTGAYRSGRARLSRSRKIAAIGWDPPIYTFQTDAEGYYGVKPESDNRRPRLKVLLRSDARGAFSFETIRPGSYPNSRAPAHIHFEVSAEGFAPRIFEIVFEGDPFVTAEMRRNPAFSVRPVGAGGKVTERIVLTR